MNLLIWVLLGGIVGWLASFFANAYRKYVMCLDVELMTAGTLLGALTPILSGGIRELGEAAESSLLVMFLTALE